MKPSLFLPKAQQEINVNFNNANKFIPFMSKNFKIKNLAPNQNLQIILIIRQINAKPEKVLR